MNQLTKMFEGRQLRIIEKDNEPWFVAKDVCEILNHSNSRVALLRLEEDEKGVSKVYTPGGYQNMSVINEFGLYSLILTSNLPEAKKFKRWITHEVIPAIRKTGSYNSIDTSQLSTELQIMNKMVNALSRHELEQKRIKQEINDTKQEIESVRQIFVLNPTHWRREVNDLIVKISKTKNTLDAYKETRLESYQRLEERARCNLDIRLENKRERMRKEGRSKTAINRVNKMDVIADDPRLTEIYLTVVKEMAIRHQVKLPAKERVI